MSLGWALDPQLLSDPQERALRPARRPLDPHLLGQLFESLQRVVSLRERPHQLLRESVGHDPPPCSAPPPTGNHTRAMTTRAGMEEWKEGRAEQERTPGFSQGGPLCLIGVRVNAEPMRLEKSKTPLASSARYAAHAPASARLLAQAGRRCEPRTARAAAARARRGPVVRARG